MWPTRPRRRAIRRRPCGPRLRGPRQRGAGPARHSSATARGQAPTSGTTPTGRAATSSVTAAGMTTSARPTTADRRRSALGRRCSPRSGPRDPRQRRDAARADQVPAARGAPVALMVMRRGASPAPRIRRSAFRERVDPNLARVAHELAILLGGTTMRADRRGRCRRIRVRWTWIGNCGRWCGNRVAATRFGPRGWCRRIRVRWTRIGDRRKWGGNRVAATRFDRRGRRRRRRVRRTLARGNRIGMAPRPPTVSSSPCTMVRAW
jgi:hypothetical protein